ncbi:MAG: YciI family protein [Pseudomonadota bacterium]
MIIVLLSYVGDVSPHRPAHVAWLKQALADGRLVTAGRQPETGGVLIANGERAEVEAWAATDPFLTSGVATASFVEFTPSLAAPGLETLLP